MGMRIQGISVQWNRLRVFSLGVVITIKVIEYLRISPLLCLQTLFIVLWSLVIYKSAFVTTLKQYSPSANTLAATLLTRSHPSSSSLDVINKVKIKRF